MNDPILDCTIVDAGPIDFWPIQEKGRCAVPACFDSHFESGVLALTHAAMSDWVLVTPRLIRIAAPCGRPKAQPKGFNDNDRDRG